MNKIEPVDANEEVFNRFANALKRSSLVRNPGQVLRQTAYAWNAICSACPDFVGRPLPVPSNKPKPKRIDIEDLPRSFGEDIDRYSVWCAIADPLDDDARARPLRATTIAEIGQLIQSAITAAV